LSRTKRAELATDAAELDERLNKVRFNLQHLDATLRLLRCRAARPIEGIVGVWRLAEG
jgi:hypothetical protein